MEKLRKIFNEIEADKQLMYFILMAVVTFILVPKNLMGIAVFMLVTVTYFILLFLMLLYLHQLRNKEED